MQEQLDKISEQLSSLKRSMEGMNRRITNLEGKDAIPGVYKQEVVEQKVELKPIQQEPLPEVVKEKKPRDFEAIFGKWLPRVGMLALVIGAGLFLKYAFDHKWIGPVGRIIIGLLSGVIILGAGEYFEFKKHHSYARVFTGGGLALLYFSLYAAHHFYGMIGDGLAFGAMAILTFVAGFFAWRYNSVLVAFYGIIGGFATPFLIGYSGIDSRVSILIYMAILNVAILALAGLKKWRILNVAAFLLTAILFAITYTMVDSRESFAVTFGFLSLYFVIFSFVPFLYNIIHRFLVSKEDVALLLFNVIYYYAFSYIIFKLHHSNLIGIFSFALAIFYLMLAYLSFSRNQEDKFLPSALLTLCVGFLTAGIALEFSKHWITILWTVEALMLIALSFYMANTPDKARFTRTLGLIAFALAAIRIVFFDFRISSSFSVIFNTRVLVSLIFVIAILISAKLYSKKKDLLAESEKGVVTMFLTVVNILMVYLISIEIMHYYSLKISSTGGRQALSYQKNAALSIAWALYAILLITIGIVKRHKPVRMMAMILFGITTLKVFFIDLSYLKGFSRIISFMILGVILLGVGFFYSKYKDKIKEFV